MISKIMTTQQLETEIREAIERYGQIFSLLRNIEENLSSLTAERLQRLTATLADLQRIAVKTDHRMMAQLHSGTTTTGGIGSLLITLESKMGETYSLNRKVIDIAGVTKTFLVHEIETNRKGMTTLNSYRQQQDYNGRILNGTS